MATLTKPNSRDAVAFPCDVFENEREFFLVGDLPGVAKDAVSVQIDRDVLTVEGKRGERAEYRRVFTLPHGIDGSKIEARLDAGVLRVKLPKEEKLRPRKIEVRAS